MRSETLRLIYLLSYPPNVENEETFEKAILKYNEVSKVLSQQNKQQNVKRKSSQISPDVTANDEQGRNFLIPKTKNSKLNSQKKLLKRATQKNPFPLTFQK